MSDDEKPPEAEAPELAEIEPEPPPEAEEASPGHDAAIAQGAEAEPEVRSEPRPESAAALPPRKHRPQLAEAREPVYRDAGGFRMRLEPADLVRLRELPGAKGRTDRELGEEFFEKQASRFVESLAEDVTPPADVRVVVDPYSRQAFLAIERVIRSILSF